MKGYKRAINLCVFFAIFILCAINYGAINNSEKSSNITTLSVKLKEQQEIKEFHDSVRVVQKLATTAPMLTTSDTSLVVKEEAVTLKPLNGDLKIDTNNILFVGNSLVEGLRMGSNGANSFICKSGIDLKSLKTKGYLDSLWNHSCDTVVIEMGTNELGWYSEEDFKNSYIFIIEKIREVNSNSRIICLSVPPVSLNQSYNSNSFNNSNVKKYNQYIKDIVELSNTTYLDCTPFFGEVLSQTMTSDGIHLKGKQYIKWYDFIIETLNQM